MLDAYLQGGCQGVSIRPVPRADLGEVFAQEPIRDHLGLIFKLGWYRLHDRAEPVSLLARNLAKNFSRVSADQSAIRHDLFSKQQRLGSKRAIGWGYSHLDQRTLYSVHCPDGRRGGASELREPHRGSFNRLDQRHRTERHEVGALIAAIYLFSFFLAEAPKRLFGPTGLSVINERQAGRIATLCARKFLGRYRGTLDGPAEPANDDQDVGHSILLT